MNKINRFLFIAFSIFTANLSSNAQWANLGRPAAGGIVTFAVNGADLFAGTIGGGVYLSTDNGESWIPRNTGLTSTNVFTLAYDGPRLFAGTAGGIFLSTDNGATWTDANLALPIVRVTSFLVSDTDVFAGTGGGGIFLRIDNGTHWTKVDSGLTTDFIHVLGAGGTNFFAGTEGDGVFRSTDRAVTWAPVNSGLPPDASVFSLASRGSTLFAGLVGGGVFRSVDGGTSWTEADDGLTGTFVSALVVDGERVFAANGGGGVFVSADDGAHWAPVNAGLTSTQIIALVVSGGNLIAVNTTSEVWRRQLSEMTGAGEGLSIVTTERWNLLSNPLVVENDSAGTIFPGAVSGAFEFETAGGYRAVSRIANGKGYWMKFTDAETISIVGERIAAETVDVAAGWNLFGSISTPISVSALRAFGTEISSDVYGYSNGYQAVDTILPGRGYWAKFEKDGKLIMAAGQVAMNPAERPDEEIELALTVTDRSDRSRTLLLLAPGTGDLSVDRYELPPLPPGGEFDVRFGSERRGERIPSSERSAEYPISLQGLESPVTLIWQRFGDTRRPMTLSLRGGSPDLITLEGEAGGEIVRLDNTRATAILRAGSLEGAGDADQPGSFALDQNYPNPFNPSTTITFTLPARSHVSLGVYDVLGAQVAALVDGALEGGSHSVTFDAANLPGGVYLCRLNAGDFTAVRKMLIVK